MIDAWKVRALLAQRGVTADERQDWLLRDLSKGAGPFLAIWDKAKLGPKPSEAELDALQAEADALAAEREAEKPGNLLMVSIADAIEDAPPNSPVRKLGEALLGLTGGGRVAGRPV